MKRFLNNSNPYSVVVILVRSTMADWSSMPNEILSLIYKRLDTFVDYFGFSYVCKPWRSVANHHLPVPQPPLLMLLEGVKQGMATTPACYFVGLCNGGEGYDENLYQLHIPEIYQNRCVGSTGNRVILVDPKRRVYIFNPFSRIQIDLPSESTFARQFNDHNYTEAQFRYTWMKKVILTSNCPNDSSRDCVAVAIPNTCGEIAIARPGDISWTAVQICDKPVTDVIFFREQLYVVATGGALFVCDINSDFPKGTRVPLPRSYRMANNAAWSKRYLVEWLGELLMVVKIVTKLKEDEVYGFTILQCDFSTCKWELMVDLREHSLFLDFNTCASVLASDSSTFKKNCVYFTQSCDLPHYVPGTHHHIMPLYMRVFDLEDGTVQRLSCPVLTSPLSPPIWIIPNEFGKIRQI